MKPIRCIHGRTLTLTLIAVLTANHLFAASSGTNSAPAANVSTSLNVVVTARKWIEPLQDVPGSVAVKSGAELADAGAKDLRDAMRDVPNLTLAEFSTRQLTFPYVRGIGSGQNDPGVATYIDGVPQRTSVTASQELLDVDRVEFLRGPQGSLYGNSSMGGVINVVPRLPSPTSGGYLALSGGNYNAFGVRGGAEGPLGTSGLLGSLSSGYSSREGYTRNDFTGHNLDSQKDGAGRAQIYLPDQGRWDFRLSVTAECDHDGDYALYDLNSIRNNPYHVSHDYEGYNNRDLLQPVFTAQRHGDEVDFTTISAFQWWKTHDSTDLDYTPADLMRQYADALDYAGIEELRFASPTDAPVELSNRINMHWLAGAFAFAERHTQTSTTEYRPLGVFYGMWPAAYQQENGARMDNLGASLFGQTTFTLDKQWELGLGLRDDFEHRSADLSSRIVPVPVLSSSSPERDFNQVCPSASLSYHITPDMLAYVKVSEGYRAGGFNNNGPESFNPETAWTYETGLKTTWLDQRLSANAALFRTIWHDMQLNVPAADGNPNDYTIENTGRARSQGAELELRAKPLHDLELFAGGALLDADFRDGSTAMTFGPPPYYLPQSANVSGNDIPFAPRVTWNAGAQLTHDLTDHLRGFIRAEVNGSTRYYFDALNGASQDAMALVNLSTGVTTANWRAELWAHNLLDRDYVALAMPYPGLAPSGYIGENGTPLTVGVSLTRYF